MSKTESFPPSNQDGDRRAGEASHVRVEDVHVEESRVLDRVTRGVLIAAPAVGCELPASPMSPLVDRPIVQHAIERFAVAGVTHLDVFGPMASESESEVNALREFVSDNERWGMHVRWHEGIASLRSCAGEDRLVMGNTEFVPFHPLNDERLRTGAVAAVHGGKPERGWALMDGQVLESLPDGCDTEQLAAWLSMLTETAIATPNGYNLTSLHDLLGAQRQMLANCSESFESGAGSVRLIGRQRTADLRICRNVKLHASVEIEGPVFLGDNCRIGKGVRLGPNTVVGPNCLIDHHAVVQNSLVLNSTYVGPWVELVDCRVAGPEVTNARWGTSVTVDDPLVVSTM